MRFTTDLCPVVTRIDNPGAAALSCQRLRNLNVPNPRQTGAALNSASDPDHGSDGGAVTQRSDPRVAHKMMRPRRAMKDGTMLTLAPGLEGQDTWLWLTPSWARLLRGLVLAPVLSLSLAFTLWSRLPAPPPRYQVTVNDRESQLPAQVHMDQALRIRLRPFERARGPLRVRAFLRQGGALRPWAVAPEVSAEGTILLDGLPSELPDLKPGLREVLFVVSRAGLSGRVADLLQPRARQRLRATVQLLP